MDRPRSSIFLKFDYPLLHWFVGAIRKDSYVSGTVQCAKSIILAIQVTAGGGRSATIWQDRVTAERHGPQKMFPKFRESVFAPFAWAIFVFLGPKYDRQSNFGLSSYFIFRIKAYIARHWYATHLRAAMPPRLYFRDNVKVDYR
jgi:hypothetical protein